MNMEQIGLRDFRSVLIQAGREVQITSGKVAGVRLTALTGDCKIRIGQSEAVSAFLGMSIKRRDGLEPWSGLWLINEGAVTISVSGYLWTNAEVGDDRILIDSTSGSIVTRDRSASPIAVAESFAAWTYAVGPVDVAVVTADVNGCELQIGSVISTDPSVVNSSAILRVGGISLGGSIEGQLYVLPSRILVAAGVAVVLRYYGSVKYSIAYNQL